MITGSIHHDDAVTNMYVHNIGAPKYLNIKQMLKELKGEIVILVWDFNTFL